MSQSFDFFLSYSRRDAPLVRQLYRRLSKDGFSVWFDVDQLRVGQNWSLEIEGAIKRCKAVIICVSPSWVNDEGYVHDELKQALDRMRRLPEGKIFLLPVRMGSCPLPRSLASLHYVDLDAPNGYHVLHTTLSDISSPTSADKTIRQEPLRWNAIADMICAGSAEVFKVDPWELAETKEGLDFKRLLRGRFEQAIELERDHLFEDLIALWAPLSDFEHFRTDHREWADAPYFRCQVHAAHCQLFWSYVSLGKSDFGGMKKYFSSAMKELEQVVVETPYSLAGGDDQLPPEAADAQNHNYLNTLRFAKEFLEPRVGGGMVIFGVSEERALSVERRVDSRIAALEYVSRRKPESRAT